MFKTDERSLEELSFDFDEAEIARIKKLLEVLKRKDLTTLSEEEIKRLERGLDRIGELKLEGKVYGWSVEDTYAAVQGGNAGEGVELYLRQGNRMEEYAVSSNRDWALKPHQVIPKLKKNRITAIYTGAILNGKRFLGIPQKSDPDDPLYRSRLNEWHIGEFEKAGIKVVVLESLI